MDYFSSIKPVIKQNLLFVLNFLSLFFGEKIVYRNIHNLRIAFDAIKANTLKSMLTALGIIFGVAAVISMLAIGKGAQQEVIDQMKSIGVNNIIINANKQQNTYSQNNSSQELKFSSGLTMSDMSSIKLIIPTVKQISPEIIFKTNMIYGSIRKPINLIGVSNSYFSIYDLKLIGGTLFNNTHETEGTAVCIISTSLKRKLFTGINPIGQYIKCGKCWLKVIGIYNKKNTSISGLNITFDDNQVYIPAKTMLLRYSNKALLNSTTKSMVNPSDQTGSASNQQLEKIIVQIRETNQMQSTVNIINRMIKRRHSNVKDFEVIVPELILKQQQRTKEIFNIVLGAIAGISLLVGGIGIMNIMYASVVERTKEIGVRMALGAKKSDITFQFLSESSIISFSGGIIGILLGVIISILISHLSGIMTIISFFSILIAFFVSVSVGIIFGFAPARKAAIKSPIESLRYE